MQKPLQNIGETTSSKVSQLATDVSDTASDYFDKSSSWLQENYGKTLGALGVLAVAGTIGFLIGRNNGRNPSIRHS